MADPMDLQNPQLEAAVRALVEWVRSADAYLA